MKRPILVVLFAAVCACARREALACAVCFGDPESNMTQSALLGVYFLGAVIGGLLICIASFAVRWTLRARAIAAREAQQ